MSTYNIIKRNQETNTAMGNIQEPISHPASDHNQQASSADKVDYFANSMFDQLREAYVSSVALDQRLVFAILKKDGQLERLVQGARSLEVQAQAVAKMAAERQGTQNAA